MMCLYARCLCMMQSWSDMLKTAVMDLLQSHTSIDFHFLKPYIQEQRSSADFWKHPAYDEGILFLKVFLKRAEHTFSSYISHCICFKNQFWEHPSLWAAERSFTTGSANHILRKLQQILPVPLCCHAPGKASLETCRRHKRASIPSAIPCAGACPLHAWSCLSTISRSAKEREWLLGSSTAAMTAQVFPPHKHALPRHLKSED